MFWMNCQVNSFLSFYRIMFGGDGILFTDTIRRVRDLLGLRDSFSVLLDIDKGKAKTEMYEEQFLPRLRSWNYDTFVPRTYQDLQDLPVILAVVEKGKMGITYPRSLRYYDLRMRLVAEGQVCTIY